MARNIKKQNKTVFHIVTIGVIFFLLVFFEIAYYLKISNDNALYIDEAEQTAQIAAQNIQEEITHKIYVVDTMKILLQNSNYNAELFEDWAPFVFTTEPGLSSIQLAPKGIVKYIYPLKGNEGAIGHDLLKDKKRNDGARMAIESEKLTFIGPVTLIQNNKKALISRRPIFERNGDVNSFWGFSTAIINIDDIGFQDYIDSEKYDYIIYGFNPDSDERPLVYGTTDSLDEVHAKANISVPNGVWHVEIKRLDISNNIEERIILILFEMFIIMITIVYRKNRLKKEHYIYELTQKLQYANRTDALTGLYNRRYFETVVELEIQNYKRYHHIFSLILIDIDHFKMVNDTYGHTAGDKVLKQISEMLKSHLRSVDTVARWGGEEFIIILPNTSGKDAFGVAEKLRYEIESSKFYVDKVITCSFGVHEASCEDYKSMFKKVDDALYEAKNSGRNKSILN